MTSSHIIIAGGTGFLGKILLEYFKDKYHTIYVFTRCFRPDHDNVKYVLWDAQTLGDWTQHIENAQVLINLCGKSVDCRYNQKNKIAIMASRVDSTRALGKAVLLAKNPPKVWINSSTATIYKDARKQLMDEATGAIGNTFSENVAQNWERTFFDCYRREVRQVAIRTSIVLGKYGGALTPLVQLAKIGLGGTQGDGGQRISWIHEKDFARSVEFIIQSEKMQGAVNLVAPTPITNQKFMQQLRKALRVPLGIPLPKPLLELGARLIKTETELILKSRNVVPSRLLNTGFSFRYSNLEKALNDLITS